MLSGVRVNGVAAKQALTMPSHELDAIDLRILAALQRDARMSNIEISHAAQLTPPTTLRRRRTLEEMGYIRGYRVQLDPKKLGFEVMAFVFVGLASQSDRDVKAFEQAAQLWVPVRECYTLTGETNFLLMCVAKSLSSLQFFIADVVMKTASVQSVKTTFVTHIAKQVPEVPLAHVFALPSVSR
jgi:DNA-binding Lrp family transcriptional regulator